MKIGPRQALALGGSAVLTAAAIGLAFYRPEWSVIPLALLLLHLTAQLILMQHRTLHGFRDTQMRLKRLEAKAKKASAAVKPEDVPAMMERLEYLQQRILVAVEASRVETAELAQRR